MKKFLVLFTLIFALSISSFAQRAVNLQAGYSWSEGALGIGYQFKTFELKAGWMPTSMPGSGDFVSGFVGTIIMGPEWDESGYYLSYAFNSVGYRSEISYNGGAWGSDVVEGMNILSVGYKAGSDFMYIKADIGYGWSGSGKGMSWGVVFGVPIGLY